MLEITNLKLFRIIPIHLEGREGRREVPICVGRGEGMRSQSVGGREEKGRRGVGGKAGADWGGEGRDLGRRDRHMDTETQTQGRDRKNNCLIS